MKKGFFSIVSAGNKPGAHVRSLLVWQGVFWVLLLVGVVSLLGTWRNTVTWLEYAYFQAVYFFEAKEHAELAQKLESTRHLTQSLAQTVEKGFRFEDRVRCIFDMPPVPVQERSLGMGGSENPFRNRWPGPGTNEISYLSGKMDVLYRQAEYQYYQLDQLKAHISEKNGRWSHMPTIWPCRGRITSEFGFRVHPIVGYPCMHEGVDIAAPAGTPVVAPANGVVHHAGYSGRFGNLLILRHGYRTRTLYGHMKKILARQGQTVRRGDLVGYVGRTGMATGPHLHFEIRKNGHPTDPRQYILPAGYHVD